MERQLQLTFKAFKCLHFIDSCSSQKAKEGTISLDLLGMGCVSAEASS